MAAAEKRRALGCMLSRFLRRTDLAIQVQGCTIRRCQFYLIYARNPIGFHLQNGNPLWHTYAVFSLATRFVKGRVTNNGPTWEGSGLLGNGPQQALRALYSSAARHVLRGRGPQREMVFILPKCCRAVQYYQ